MPGWASIALSATVPARVMVAGIDRSILPGPSVMTNIWPSPTIAAKEAKVSAACVSPPALAPPVKRTVIVQTSAAAR